MYKVFINEKKIIISEIQKSLEKTLKFEDTTTFEITLDLLENTSCTELNIYGEKLEILWKNFKQFFKIVEAAGGIVTNTKEEILFIHRLGKWDLPKGKIEKGEKVEDAAIREVEEETSLIELQLIDFIDNTYHIYREKDGTPILKITHWFKMKYVGNQYPKPQIEEGIKKAEWLGNDTIKNEVLPSTFKNIQLILKQFSNF